MPGRLREQNHPLSPARVLWAYALHSRHWLHQKNSLGRRRSRYRRRSREQYEFV
jgi:hypothetical protein